MADSSRRAILRGWNALAKGTLTQTQPLGLKKTLQSAVRKAQHRKQRRPFPYLRVATMWEQGKTIEQIAHAIGMIDEHNKKDRYHSLRNFLYRMHTHAYRNASGKIVKQPYRFWEHTIPRRDY